MRLASFVFLFCLTASCFSSGLPPEHESSRLLLIVEEAVANNNWSLADESLGKMADLQVELPVSFFFYNGWVHFKQERFEKAQHSLEHYAVKVGPSGAFYYDALKLLTSIERSLEKKLDNNHAGSAASENSSSAENSYQKLVLVNEERDAYVQSLKALYLTDDPIEALVMQINSLLSAHPYTGSRVKKATERQGVKFQISIQDNLIVLQENNFQDGFPQLSAKKLEVNGIDPFVSVDCSSRDMACWLTHPSDIHEKWILVAHDDLVVNELSQAFTRLIQLLQQK